VPVLVHAILDSPDRMGLQLQYDVVGFPRCLQNATLTDTLVGRFVDLLRRDHPHGISLVQTVNG